MVAFVQFQQMISVRVLLRRRPSTLLTVGRKGGMYSLLLCLGYILLTKCHLTNDEVAVYRSCSTSNPVSIGMGDLHVM